jgi:hypothetical protein
MNESLKPNTQETRPRIERKGNIARIETREALYVIAYGQHNKAQDYRDIPDNTRIVFLENSTGDWSREYNGYDHFRTDEQYGGLVQSLEQRNISICFSDVNIKRINIPKIRPLPPDFITLMAETALGSGLIYSAVKRNSENTRSSRRKFLSKTSKAIAGTYLLSPMISGLGRGATYQNGLGEHSVEARKFINDIHPEIDIIVGSFREAVMGFKEQWLAESIGNKPVIATVIGAIHVGLEEVLQSTQQDKLNLLKKFKSVLDLIVSVPETFYTVRINNADGTFETLVIPELKELWEGASSHKLNPTRVARQN